jgi:nucleoside-diphosphate-sugar epimerase
MKDKHWADDTPKSAGAATRALDITRTKKLLNWEPKKSLKEGLQKTINRYISTHAPKGYVDEKLLMERLIV